MCRCGQEEIQSNVSAAVRHAADTTGTDWRLFVLSDFPGERRDHRDYQRNNVAIPNTMARVFPEHSFEVSSIRRPELAWRLPGKECARGKR